MTRASREYELTKNTIGVQAVLSQDFVFVPCSCSVLFCRVRACVRNLPFVVRAVLARFQNTTLDFSNQFIIFPNLSCFSHPLLFQPHDCSHSN